MINTLKALEADKRGGNAHAARHQSRDESTVAFCALLSGSDTTPSYAAARREAAATIESAMDRLPEHYRAVVRMYDLEGRPLNDVAKALKRRPGAVLMLRARAHHVLKQLLGKTSDFFSDCA